MKAYVRLANKVHRTGLFYKRLASGGEVSPDRVATYEKVASDMEFIVDKAVFLLPPALKAQVRTGSSPLNDPPQPVSAIHPTLARQAAARPVS